METSMQQFTKMIDHTLVKSTATKDDIAKLCEEAEKRVKLRNRGNYDEFL